MGNYQKALELYEKIHSDYPDNLECEYVSGSLVCLRKCSGGQVVRLVQTTHCRVCLALSFVGDRFSLPTHRRLLKSTLSDGKM